MYISGPPVLKEFSKTNIYIFKDTNKGNEGDQNHWNSSSPDMSKKVWTLKSAEKMAEGRCGTGQ